MKSAFVGITLLENIMCNIDDYVYYGHNLDNLKNSIDFMWFFWLFTLCFDVDDMKEPFYYYYLFFWHANSVAFFEIMKKCWIFIDLVISLSATVDILSQPRLNRFHPVAALWFPCWTLKIWPLGCFTKPNLFRMEPHPKT